MNEHSTVDVARLNRCLNPQSIAVVGGAEAAQVIRQCRKLGFSGELWAVNPKLDSLDGLACHARVDDLPAPPDAAFIAIPAAPSIAVVEALARRGAGGAVCYASGFKEIGAAGEQRQRRLIAAAAGMPIIGPNCYGFINLLCGAALWPDYHGASRVDKGVAIFSQSGNVSLNLSMQRRLLPLAWLVTLGNQAGVGIEEGIQAALGCDRITAIGLHLEGLNNLPLFARLAEQARRRGIPMVALKGGRSAIGARITLSHTATLAGEEALYDALFERLGVGRAATPEEFIETLKLLSVGGVLGGNRMASMSCSGGEATLVADLAAGRALEFPALEEAHRQRVQATLNGYVRVDNPLDYHTFIWGDEARMTATFSAMLSADFDLALLILDTPADDAEMMAVWLRAVRAFIAACHACACKGALVSLLSESLPEPIGRLLIDNAIAPLQGLAQALAAAEAACGIGMAWSRNAHASACGQAMPPSLTPVFDIAPKQTLRNLDERQAKQLLSGAGLPIAESRLADSPEAAVAAAEKLGYPVVVKALSSSIAHKTDLGAVAVDLQTAAQVHAHGARMLGVAAGAKPLAERLLVEKMIEGAVAEMLLGVGYDRQFGHYLIIGFGGALVELIGDRELLLPPVDEAMLMRALERLKTAPLLRGYRGRPSADVAAVAACALKLSAILGEGNMDDGHASDEWNNIVEIEINPLMIKPDGKGAIVADALITLHDSKRRQANTTQDPHDE